MEAATAAIPATLRGRAQWVTWREELRGDKQTKVPYCARGGPGSTTARSTWSTFDAALEAAGDVIDRPDRGIGFVLSDDDPFVAIDLDEVRDPHTGELAAGIDELVDGFDSFVEISPTGTGLHVWVEANLNGSRNRTGNVEMYSRARYMTCTGLRLPGTPPRSSRASRCSTASMRLRSAPTRRRSRSLRSSGSRRASTSTTTTSCSSGRSPTAATSCAGCSKATPSATAASRSELALLAILRRWTGDDLVRLDRLYRRSGLCRPKWGERRGRTTYGERTLQKAVSEPLPADAPRAAANATPASAGNGNGGPDGEPPFRTWTMAELLREAPEAPEWILEGYIAPQTQVMLWGAPKVGKSTLLFRLLGTLGEGGTVLGLEARRVTYMLLSEESHHTIAEKAFRFRADTADSDVVLFSDTRGTLWPQVVRHCVERCKQRGHRLLIVDTLARWGGLAGESENHAGSVMAVLEPLAQAVEAGMSVLVLHHARKGGGKHGEGARGSSAFVGAVDVSLELARTSLEDSTRVLRALSRFADTPAELGIRLDGNDYELVDIEAERADELSDADRRLLELLDDGARLARDALADELGVSRATVSERLRKLERLRLVEHSGRGIGGDPFVYHRVFDAE